MNSTKLLNNFMVPIKVIFCEFINSTTHVQCSHFILLLRYNHCLDCPMAVNQYHDQNANTQAWREKYFTYFSPSVCVGIFFCPLILNMRPCMVLIVSGMIRIHNTESHIENARFTSKKMIIFTGWTFAISIKM